MESQIVNDVFLLVLGCVFGIITTYIHLSSKHVDEMLDTINFYQNKISAMSDLEDMLEEEHGK